MQNDIIGYLAEKWDALMAGVQANHRDSVLSFGNIITAYQEPQRFYHTLAHISALMQHADELEKAGLLADPVSIRMAIFYHDIVYDTNPAILQDIKEGRLSSNEESSAQMAIEDMTALGFDAETIARTARMIRLTQTHKIEKTDTLDTGLFLDIDMSILSEPPEAYALYVSQIYMEYAQIDKEKMIEGRKAFLKQALQSDHIFHTAVYSEIGEKNARVNLARELSVLTAGGGLAMLRQVSSIATQERKPSP